MSKKIHFIAVGGSIMHNMAIALHKTGYVVSGSDDEIYEPSKSRLSKHGLLPVKNGWDADRITEDLDAIILGMHARPENPELLRAQELGIKIYSFPEFIYEQSKDKQRVVIAGSHGKTSITSMILHVLKYHNRSFDYAVGAQIQGFGEMVQFSDAPVIIIEGDEYLTSPIDRTPKFLKYHHHIGLISGIAWDHINVFPTQEEYNKQFELFVNATPSDGTIVYFNGDKLVSELNKRNDHKSLPYDTHAHLIENGITYLITNKTKVPLKVFGKHNLQNLNGARFILNKIGIVDEEFYEAIQSFEGAANRLEVTYSDDKNIIFKDFAHAPSKVRATTASVREQYPEREVVACLELHTFSSLTKEFLKQYNECLEKAHFPCVYFDPKIVKRKKLAPITANDVRKAFKTEGLEVFTDRDQMVAYLKEFDWTNKNLLLMSSGDFGHLDYSSIELILHSKENLQ
ncbi:MAG: Mur ligase family protein [Bacteroidota bacterium]